MNSFTRCLELTTQISDLAGFVGRIGQLQEQLILEKEIPNNSSIVTKFIFFNFSNEVDSISYSNVTLYAPDSQRLLLKG